MMRPPPLTPDIAPFWAAAAKGELAIKHCNTCAANHFFPRPHCPFCMSADTAWLTCSGEGEIYSFTTQKRGPAPAYITLKEGPTILSAIVDATPEALRIGARVAVAFQPLGDGQPPMPVFRLL